MFSIDDCISGSPQSIINLDFSTNHITHLEEGYHMVLMKVADLGFGLECLTTLVAVIL